LETNKTFGIMMYRITKIISVKPFKIICLFNNQETRLIDFTDWVKEFSIKNNGWTSKLADPDYFQTVQLADYGTLAWSNEVDFDPGVLFEISKSVS
jgi:hypothetical protein